MLAQQLSHTAVDGRGASGHPLNDGLEHWNRDIEKVFGSHGFEIDHPLHFNSWYLLGLFVLLMCIRLMLFFLFLFIMHYTLRERLRLVI